MIKDIFIACIALLFTISTGVKFKHIINPQYIGDVGQDVTILFVMFFIAVTAWLVLFV